MVNIKRMNRLSLCRIGSSARRVLQTSAVRPIVAQRSFGVPLVIEQDGAGERAYDIYSRLLKDRIICVFGTIYYFCISINYFSGQVSDQLSAAVVAQLLFLASDKPDQPIKMYINSPGGSVTAGMVQVKTMLNFQLQYFTKLLFCTFGLKLT